jgi:hypothetical protein
MRSEDPNVDRAVNVYSPFWPVFIVFATLIFVQAAYVIGDFQQQSQLKTARAQLQPLMVQAQTINQTTEAVGRELMAMSTNSPEAAKIIKEFKIQLNHPAGSPPATPPASAPKSAK